MRSLQKVSSKKTLLIFTFLYKWGIMRQTTLHYLTNLHENVAQGKHLTAKKKTKTYLPSLNYALLVKLSFLHFHYQYKMRTNDKRLIMFASITWSFKWSITKFSLNCSINVHMFLLIDLNFTWMENKGFNIRVKGLQKRIALFKKISNFYKRKELHCQKSTPG